MSEAAKETTEKDPLTHLVALANDMRKKKDTIIKESDAKMQRQVDLLNDTFMEKPEHWKLSAEGREFSKKVHAEFDEAAESRRKAAFGSCWLSQQIQRCEADAKRQDGDAAAPSSSGGGQNTGQSMEEDWSETLHKAMDDAFFDRCTKGGPSDYSLEAGKKRKRPSEQYSDSQDDGRN